MADEELFTVRDLRNREEARYVSAPMPLEAAIRHLWEVSRKSPAGSLHSVSVMNRQGDVIYQEHPTWVDWEHKELGETWGPSKYNGKDPRAIAIVRALTGKKPLRPRKKKVKLEVSADVVSLPTRVRWTLGEVAQGTAETEVVSLSSAKATRKIKSLIKGLDPEGLLKIPMGDITIGTDTPEAIQISAPIILGAQAYTAVKKLFSRFGIDETPVTYGELKGGWAYCDALIRLGNNCSGSSEDSKLYFECTLEVVVKHSPELVESLTAYVQGDLIRLKQATQSLLPLSEMAKHFDEKDGWISYPLDNPLPMQQKTTPRTEAPDDKVVNFSSARAGRQMDRLIQEMDPDNLFSIPMDDVAVGTDTPDDIASTAPIILGAQALVAVRRLFLRFGISETPVTYGELKGGIAYCDALVRLSGNSMGTDDSHKRYFKNMLSVVSKDLPELVAPLTAYVNGDAEALKKASLTLAEMSKHYNDEGDWCNPWVPPEE